MEKIFPVIDPVATGENIVRLRKARGLTVRDLQDWFGFEEPQAIYKWQKGKSLPTVDNLYALSALLDTSIEDILVPCKLKTKTTGQQGDPCCPVVFCPAVLNTAEFGPMFPFGGSVPAKQALQRAHSSGGIQVLPKGSITRTQNGEVRWSGRVEEKRDGGGFA